MADAVHSRDHTIVTMGEPQSNHARLAAAAAKRLGLHIIIIIAGRRPKRFEGNLLLCDLLGAELRFADWSRHSGVVEHTIKALEQAGHSTYLLPFGGSTALACVAYFNTAIELLLQAQSLGIEIGHIAHASASGGLQTGLTLGIKALGSCATVLGIASSKHSDALVRRKANDVGNDLSRLLHIDLTIRAEDMCLFDHFSPSNSTLSADSSEIMGAIELVAQTEGILLDPEYTGKAMAVLLNLIRSDYFSKNENVIFIHTGGIPALFTQTAHGSLPFVSRIKDLYRQYRPA